MERANCRKRRREGDEKKEWAKKVDLSYFDDYLDNNNKENSYETCKCDDPFMAVGVFDFPWLKEGVIFKTDDSEEFEEAFASCTYVDEASPVVTADLELSGQSQILCKSLTPLNFHDDDKFEDNLPSLQVDELCIWSSVLDQPLVTGFNKLYVLCIYSSGAERGLIKAAPNKHRRLQAWKQMNNMRRLLTDCS
ncbi:hypothetical protein F0562_027058 [Nyssa sinensis]|uniref:Uncharacterized protein n=1 Tax=Nyssa sinensis TaxID=561372 RepID=A0A5J5B1U0_9ASTE|nr:hypothetical protein F0562_027058 [Nyssa sinensis]